MSRFRSCVDDARRRNEWRPSEKAGQSGLDVGIMFAWASPGICRPKSRCLVSDIGPFPYYRHPRRGSAVGTTAREGEMSGGHPKRADSRTWKTETSSRYVAGYTKPC